VWCRHIQRRQVNAASGTTFYATQLECSNLQVKNLERQMSHTNKDMARLNSLISSNQYTAASLEDKYFHLQQSVMSELKDQETEAKKLENEVAQCSAKKKELLSEVLETEREIMLWERKLQLDREMRELLDPTVGQVNSSQCY
jgi:coiled-coil domain-containing protein 40